MTTQPPQGWFPDAQDASLLRWWDGTRWTEHTHPAAAAQGMAHPPVVAEQTAAIPAPSPFPSAPPKARRGRGLVIAVIVAIVVGALIVAGVMQAYRGAKGDTGSGTDSGVAEVNASASDLVVPDGFVAVLDETAKITFAIPAGWSDVTAQVAPIMQEAMPSAPEEALSIAGVWANSADAAMATDQTTVIYSSYPEEPQNIEVAMEGWILGFENTATNVVRVSEENFTTSSGYPARKSVVTSDFPVGATTTTFYVIAEGTRYVVVSYATFGGDDSSAEVRQLVDSIVIY